MYKIQPWRSAWYNTLTDSYINKALEYTFFDCEYDY